MAGRTGRAAGRAAAPQRRAATKSPKKLTPKPPEGRALIAAIRTAATRIDPLAPWITLLDAAGGETVLTPSQVLAGANAWAHLLKQRGLAPGDRVIICLDHGPDLYLAYLGALLADCVPSFAAATSPKQPVAATLQALEHLLVNTAPQALVKENGLNPAHVDNVKLISPSSVDRAAGGPDYWTEDAPSRGAGSFAFIQYSSGTTGAKKGVGITEDMLVWQLNRYAETLQVSAADRIVSWLPLYHDMGLMTAYFLPLMHGIPLIAMSPFEWVKTPQMLLKAIARYKATLCWLPNFAYEFLAKYAGDGKFDLSSVRQFVNCSEPVMATSHAKFLAQFTGAGVKEAALGTCYAMAETTFAVTSSVPGQPARKHHYMPDPAQPAREVVSSGVPLRDTAVKILDDNGHELPAGMQGRICVQMPSLFSGYLRGDVIDTGSLDDGWHTTGDVGFMEGGELFVLGRADDVVIIAGQNIFPQDVENIVNDVEGTISGRNVAFGVFEPVSGTEALVVLVEVRDPAASVAAGLDRVIAGRINAGAGIAPKAIRLVPHMSLVKSTSGKISRKINRERFLADQRQAPAAAPEPAPSAVPGDITATIRQSIAAVLERKSGTAPRFGDAEPLFEFGLLDSLSFVDLVVELESRLGRAVPQVIVDNPRAHDTVVALAAAFSQPVATATAAAAGGAKLVGARERRQQLSPHLADTDRTPLEPRAYVMLIPQPNFTSPSANTDEYGFRIALKQGRRVVLNKLRGAEIRKGIVLGNSQIWGTGASKDEHVVHNVLNAERADECWYSFALRNSTLTQERLAAELYAPLDPAHAVWISGTVTLNVALTNASHARIFPFPSQARFTSLMQAPPALDRDDATWDRRWAEVLDLFEREITLFARLFGRTAPRPLFVLQPVISWCEKPWSAEEQEVNDLFRAEGGKAIIDPETFNSIVKMFINEGRKICDRHGVTFVHAADNPEFKVKDWLFVDGAHMTDAGHKALAQVIARNLA